MTHYDEKFKPEFLVLDLFSGAGGVSSGFHLAKINGRKVAFVVAAINHDPIAIKSHEANYPDTVHYVEDITKMYGSVKHGILFESPEMVRLKRLFDLYRAFYPDAKVIIWGSIECTNFSKAKGGMERDADSRTLGEHMDRYIAALDPDYVQIENVVEFMSWGPMEAKTTMTKDGNLCCKVEFEEILEDVIDYDQWGEAFVVMQRKKNKLVPKQVGTGKFVAVYGKYPVSKKNGRDWLRWREHLCSFGYRDDWKEMNSADFGARTSRNRLFGIFSKPGLPIVWPKPTHSKKPNKGGMFGDLKKWMPVRECLDLGDHGESIFGRKKDLVPKTLERIYAGLVKFVANGDDMFIQKHFSGRPWRKVISTNGPAGTITTTANQGVVFLSKYYSGEPSSKNTSVDNPCDTLRTKDGVSIVNAEFIYKYYSNGGDLTDTGNPSGSLTTKDRMAVVFLDQQYGNSKPSGLDEPVGTLTGNPKFASYFIDRNFTSGGGKHVDLNGPMGAIMTVPKANLVEVEQWIQNYYSGSPECRNKGLDEPCNVIRTANCQYLMSTNFNNIGRALDEPSPVITANRKHHYLVNPQWNNKGNSLDDPSFTLIARMDKAPPYLVEAETGCPVIVIYPGESEIMQKIKLFMAAYGITDIKMRMLKVPELLKIQGFPPGYKLKGTQTDQKKFIGNSVVPLVVKVWIEAMSNYSENYQMAA